MQQVKQQQFLTKKTVGQATLEFAMMLGFGVILLLWTLPLIKEVIQQKSADAHSRAEVTFAFNNGKNLGEIHVGEVFIPALDTSQIIPNLPGVSLGNFGNLLGDLTNFFGMPNLMDFLGIDGADSILGSAMQRGAVAYVTSGFDSNAAMRGALQGAIEADQFGRWADSQWNSIFGEGSIEWQDSALQDNWGDNIGWASDFAGSYTQGFLSTYIGSDGNIQASVFGGFAQGWQTKGVQDWLNTSLGSDFWVGVTNGSVNGLMQVGGGADDAGLTIGLAAAQGGFMSKTVQDKIFGSEAKLGASGNYGLGMIGSAANGAFAGALAYAKSEDKNSQFIWMGAAMSMATYTASYGYEASGAKKVVDDTTSAVKKEITDTVTDVKDATGVTAVEETVKETVNDAKTAVQNELGTNANASANDSTELPQVSEGSGSPESGTGSADTSTPSDAPTTTAESPINPDGSKSEESFVRSAVSTVAKATSDSTFVYSLALTAVAAATLASADKETGQSGDTHAPTTTTAPSSGLGSESAVAQNNPATATATTNGTTPAFAPTAKVGNTGLNTLQNSSMNKSASTTLSSKSPTIRLPQDVNTRSLATSKLTHDLKTHRNQAVNMIKIGVAQRLTSDYQQQLISTGMTSTQVASLLNDPQTKERIQKAVDDPRVEEAVERMLDEALNDENFLVALENAKDDQVKQQALLTQLKMRALERQKSSSQPVYNSSESDRQRASQSISQKVLHKLRGMIRSMEIWS